MKAIQLLKKYSVLDWIILVVLVVVFYNAAGKIGGYAQKYYRYGYNLVADSAVDRPGEGKTVSLEILSGMTVSQVGNLLEENGLIRSSSTFVLKESMSEYKGQIQPGTYEVSSEMSMDQILALITGHGEAEE
ncbi:MAG: endolytic transglycosylase MltG [Lachnospiraceae bacterium]|nr:endolytic transglycosylase MltG [Lachnospiraceae bacterium]